MSKQETFDIKKEFKFLYKATKPKIITLPAMKHISLKGHGNPNGSRFKEQVEALYATAYTIRMSYRNDFAIQGYYPFVVAPLQGDWDTLEGEYLGNKDQLQYTVMIPMPDFVTKAVVEKARKSTQNKKDLPALGEVAFLQESEKKVCVSLHRGSYDDEAGSFKIMEAYVKESHHRRSQFSHREIYLNDPRKTTEEKLKTLLLFEVEQES